MPTQAFTYSRETLLQIGECVKQHKSLCQLPLDAFHTICSLDLLSVKRTQRGTKAGVKYKQKSAKSAKQSSNGLSLFSVNCQSVKTKTTHGIVTDLVVEHDIDIFALTETWINDDESDDFYVDSLNFPGYELFN